MNKNLDKYFFLSKEDKSVLDIIEILNKDECSPIEIFEVLTRICGLSIPEARTKMREFSDLQGNAN